MKQETIRSYQIGFILSVLLTLAAFFMVLRPEFFALSNGALIAAILILAFVQLIIQLIFFLHLGSESGPRWKLAAFVATAGIVLLVVIGSIWIMGHLNYNMMASPTDMNKYIQSQDGL